MIDSRACGRYARSIVTRAPELDVMRHTHEIASHRQRSLAVVQAILSGTAATLALAAIALHWTGLATELDSATRYGMELAAVCGAAAGLAQVYVLGWVRQH